MNTKETKTCEEITDLLHQHLPELQQQHAVADMALFGSFARGDQRPDSDVDILVEFTKPIGFVAFLRLEQRLEELLGRKVDLVTRKALKPHIGKHILKETRHVRHA